MKRSKSHPKRRVFSLQPDIAKFAPYLDAKRVGKSRAFKDGARLFLRDARAVAGCVVLLTCAAFAVASQPAGNTGVLKDIGIALCGSFSVGAVAALLAFALGFLFGRLSCALRSKAGEVAERAIRATYAIPDLPVAFLLIVVLDQVIAYASIGSNTLILCIVFPLLYNAGAAYLTRTRAIMTRDDEYVQTASIFRAYAGGIKRNRLRGDTLRVYSFSALLLMPSAIIAETVAAFLGFGVKSPLLTLGALANTVIAHNGASAVFEMPLLTVLPCALAVALSLSLWSVGNGLRSAFAPVAANDSVKSVET